MLAEDAPEPHTGTKNIIKEHSFVAGDDREFIHKPSTVSKERRRTQVSALYIENHTAYASWTIWSISLSSVPPRFPHRSSHREPALGVPLGRIRVIKPYIGGGFGNKQDVVLEPMVAFPT
jgi:xanthine dehydrogenase molybdenum-binding subunit